MNGNGVFLEYLKLGFEHVIPLGFDHILFIVSLFLLNSKVNSVLIQCSVFTIAHSITLGLTAAGYIFPDTAIIEPVIAFSIVITALENIIHSDIKPWRLVMIFIFGLIHGMGFASALQETGLPESDFISALLAFNIGVELGQVAIVVALWAFISRWALEKSWYKTRIVYPTSCIMACIALYWTLQRILE